MGRRSGIGGKALGEVAVWERWREGAASSLSRSRVSRKAWELKVMVEMEEDCLKMPMSAQVMEEDWTMS